MIPIAQLFVSFGLVFICCELAQRITNKFDEINAQIDKFKWYSFPLKVQKILPTLMVNAQQPVDLECFGSIACNRETFQRVSSCCSMCFMIYHWDNTCIRLHEKNAEKDVRNRLDNLNQKQNNWSFANG